MSRDAKISAAGSHWKAIACDLDGTLIGRDHKVLERDLAALRQARAAGFHVAICTGRNAIESAGVIGALELSGLGVFVNGAMVCDMATGKAVHSRYVPLELAQEALAFFGATGHAVLMLADDERSRLPLYFMSDHGPPHRGTLEWLMLNHMHSTTCSDLPGEHRQRLVRVGVIVNVSEAAGLEAAIEKRFASRAESHSIYSPYYDCQVIELFSRGTSKWSGIEMLAREIGCGPEQVIAIGDDVNDLPMLRGARLSFAMATAPAEIRAAAKRVTSGQPDCGVAMVIDDLLAGKLEPTP